MKLLTFAAGGGSRLGAIDGDGNILDVAECDPSPYFRTMQALIEGGREALDHLRSIVEAGGPALSPDSVRFLAPLPRPVQIRDFVAFEKHMRAAGWNGAKLRERWGAAPAPPEPPPVPPIWYKQPLYYKCNRLGVSGHDDRILWPSFSSVIDYELEIACVIGKRGRDISIGQAPDHIFGYTIFNDLTARDTQFAEMQGPFGPAKGKDFDQGNVLGPVIVTADELDLSALAMRAYVNGELWSEGSSATMHWTFPDMIAHVSRGETLFPGEIFGSGTVGNGCGLELGRFLKHGDVVTLDVEGIGRLSATIDAPHVLEGVTL